ncbi:MAG: glycosyltransferase family 4 protein [Ignavibacterium sp.]|nr:glycosyltransferase family 4 protein [Ignavibacterium sp.]
MKVLLVHNFYQSSSPSGEDAVFRNEWQLLKKNGIEVITYEKHNDEIGDYGLGRKLLLPFRNIWSCRTYRELTQVLKKEKPDIAHFQNIWYLISPSAYYACRDAGVPVVQTLHNFRISCVNGLLLRNGHVCEECITKKAGNRSEVMGHGNKKINDRSGVMGDRLRIIQNAIRYGCYRNSRVYSIPVALMQYLHWVKKTWSDKVDAYIALTEFGRQKFIEAGLPADKIFVKPNFLADPPAPNYSNQNYAVFLGRLSPEKGLSVLINAFQYLSSPTHNPSPITHHPFNLKIVGDGPLMENLQHIVSAGKMEGIEFTGRKSFAEAMVLLGNARFMIMPSMCYEGFPMAIREAFACGKPVIASNLGSMAELVENGKTGLLFEPGNPVDLAEKMKWMIGYEAECIEMGKEARKVFEENYTAERNFEILMGIYNNVMSNG